MTDKLKELQSQLDKVSSTTNLDKEALLLFPENFRAIHSFKVFGDDLLAIPASLKIAGDDDEFEIPFSFLDDLSSLKIFDSEFRPEIPQDFIQIGSLYGATEMVVLNKIKNTVHTFHVADIVDERSIKYSLKKEVGTLETFIENMRPQTVCCLMDPKNRSKWDIFEIRNTNELKNDGEVIKYPDEETTWEAYKKLVAASLRKGYELHYAPKRLRQEMLDAGA